MKDAPRRCGRSLKCTRDSHDDIVAVLAMVMLMVWWWLAR